MTKLIDITGKRFGALTVLGRSQDNRSGDSAWECQCDCGRKTNVSSYSLRHGIVTSCGCGIYRSSKRKGIERGMQVDYTGQKFGRLTAVKWVSSGKWLWQCDCGNYTVAKPPDVKTGNPASCGCLLKEASKKRIEDDNVLEHHDGTSVSTLKSIMSGKLRSTNTSGYTGITVRRTTAMESYRACIVVKGKKINLGTYARIEDAVAARKRAEEIYYAPIINKYDGATDDKTESTQNHRTAPRITNGSALARIRIERGMTQVQLADMIGTSQNMISRWETGSRIPSGRSLVKIAAALNCTVDELLK